MSGAVLVTEVTAAPPEPASPSPASSDVRLLSPSAAVVAPVTVSATGVSVHYPVLATNFTAASLSATISVPTGRGTFSFTSTSGLTALFGYASVSGVPTTSHEIGFFGDRNTVIEALSDRIRWTGGTPGDVTVSVSVNAYEDGVAFNPANGHYYELHGSPDLNWNDASTSAAGKNRFGLSGYLATITSEAENDFISSKVNARNVWIGAFYNGTNWIWATGPETGTAFWSGTGRGTGIAGQFASWHPNEPNASGNCGLTNWGSLNGQWDDQPCETLNNAPNLKAYLVEYGPPSGTVQAVSQSITASVVAPATLTVQVDGDGVVSSSPAGIDCGVTCAAQYPTGNAVVLTATPGDGQRLVSWSGSCAGASTCTVTMAGDQTVSATFAVVPVLPPQLPALVVEPVLTTPPSTVAPSTTVRPPTSTTPPTTQAPSPSPVPADPSGALPSLSPGESSVTEDGVTTPVEVVVENATDLVLRGGDFELRLAGDCTGGCTVQTDDAGRQVIRLERDGSARVAGAGFLPGTPVYVWLFSTPTFLGELTVAADGTFSGLVPLAGVETGQHTLQVNGTSFDGEPRTANLGVIVAEAAVPGPGDGQLPSTGRDLGLIVWSLLLAAAGGVLLVTRRRLA